MVWKKLNMNLFNNLFIHYQLDSLELLFYIAEIPCKHELI